MKIFFILLAVLWAVSVVVTIYDKIAAKIGSDRISEKNLLLLGLFGGALPMYCAMRLIRHKTKHAKFMVLLPMMVLFHISVTMTVLWLCINFI